MHNDLLLVLFLIQRIHVRSREEEPTSSRKRLHESSSQFSLSSPLLLAEHLLNLSGIILIPKEKYSVGKARREDSSCKQQKKAACNLLSIFVELTIILQLPFYSAGCWSTGRHASHSLIAVFCTFK